MILEELLIAQQCIYSARVIILVSMELSLDAGVAEYTQSTDCELTTTNLETEYWETSTVSHT